MKPITFEDYKTLEDYIRSVMDLRGLTFAELGKRYGGSYAAWGSSNGHGLIKFKKGSPMSKIQQMADALEVDRALFLQAFMFHSQRGTLIN